MKTFVQLMMVLFLTMCSAVPATASIQPASTIDVVANWIDSNSAKGITLAKARQYAAIAFEMGKKYRIDPLLVVSMIHAESGFRASVGNRYGARGLMQVVPRFHKEKIKGGNILNPNTNIDVGVQILNEYMDGNNQNFAKALKKYSGGASKKYSSKIQKSHRALVEEVLMWKMQNDQPINQVAVFSNPRAYHRAEEAQPDPLGVMVASLTAGRL